MLYCYSVVCMIFCLLHVISGYPLCFVYCMLLWYSGKQCFMFVFCRKLNDFENIKMPKIRTSFQNSWLHKIDSNGHQVSLWCEKGGDEFHARCFVCRKEFLCDNAGLPQLLQHCDGSCHKKLAKSLCSSSQGRITLTSAAHDGTATQ